MALSGIKTIKYGLTDATQLVFSWEAISRSIADNYTTFKFRFYVKSSSGYTSLGVKEKYKFTIQGFERTGEAAISVPANGEQELYINYQKYFHNNDGTFNLSIDFSLTRNAIDFKTISGSIFDSVDLLPRPAKIDSANNFYNTNNAKITYSSPAGYISGTLEAGIKLTSDGINLTDDSAVELTDADIAFRAIPTDGTNSYTFAFTDAERVKLNKAVSYGSSTTVKYYIRNKIGNDYYYDYVVRTLSLADYAPTLTPVVIDVNSRTTRLTGNNNKFIRYMSNAQVTFNAQAYAGAYIEYRRATCGANTIEIDDREQDTVLLNAISSNTIYLTAKDSRAHYVDRASIVQLIPYVKLTNRITSTQLSANGELTFTISGKYYNGSFGTVSNSLELEFTILNSSGNPVFNTAGGGWIKLGTITPSMNGDDYTFTQTISGLNYQESYTLTVNAIDELTPVQTSSKVIATIPVFDWSNEDFQFNVPVYLKGSNVPLDNMYDFVVDEGSNRAWYYRKWNSGRAEIYGYQAINNTACNTALGNMYRTAVITPDNFPFTLNSAKVIACYESEGYGAFLWFTTLANSTKPGNYYLVRPTSSAAITGKVNFYAQGTWK